jgi:membrane protease YdiL (CAAX protease family)
MMRIDEQIPVAIEAPGRSSLMGSAIVLTVMALLSLALTLPWVEFWVKLAVIGGLTGLAIAGRAVYAVHSVLFAALLLIPAALFPLFRVWPFTLLGPLVLYGAVVFAVPWLRHSVGWMRRGIIDRNATLLIIAAVLVSSLSLVGWVLWAKPDIKSYLALMPALPVWVYPFVGLGFSVVNAAMEEIVFRGIFMEAIDSAVGSGFGSVCIQAVPFAALHYLAGFPRGMSGLAMTFAYGVMLGAIRLRSKGMLAPLVTHIAADMTIFSILVVHYFQL